MISCITRQSCSSLKWLMPGTTSFNAAVVASRQVRSSYLPAACSRFAFSSKQSETSGEIEEKTRLIFDELKDRDNQGQGVGRFTREKEFQNYTIYDHPMDSKTIISRIRLRLLGSSFWFGCGVAVFHFVNQYAALLPLIVMSKSIMNYQLGLKYSRSLISKVELNENLESVKLTSVSGDVYESAINEMEFQTINDLSAEKKVDEKMKANENSDISKLKKNSFLAVFDTTDSKGVFRRDLKILFNDQLVNMENAELLTKVLRGDIDAVKQFKYTERKVNVDESEDVQDEAEISDEKLTEILQEEIKKRNKN